MSHNYRITDELHTEPLTVKCPNPICERETTLPITKRNAPKFVGEWCDGTIGARHPLAQMLGPEGEPNA